MRPAEARPNRESSGPYDSGLSVPAHCMADTWSMLRRPNATRVYSHSLIDRVTGASGAPDRKSTRLNSSH